MAVRSSDLLTLSLIIFVCMEFIVLYRKKTHLNHALVSSKIYTFNNPNYVANKKCAFYIELSISAV